MIWMTPKSDANRNHFSGAHWPMEGRDNWLLRLWHFFWPPLQYSCLENPMDRGASWAAVHGVVKSRTWLSNFTFTFRFHASEKEMATHSNVLAWRTPGTAGPGGLLLSAFKTYYKAMKWDSVAPAQRETWRLTEWNWGSISKSIFNIKLGK